MTPYYSERGITIYHGDCRQILPQLGRFDLLLTDPPYGIGRDGQVLTTGGNGGRKAYEFMGWDSEIPSRDCFESLFHASSEQVIWGANYFVENLPPSMGWLGQRAAHQPVRWRTCFHFASVSSANFHIEPRSANA